MKTTCKQFKALFASAVASVALLTGAQAQTLAEARAQIDSAVTNPAQLTDTVKQLPAADQVGYVSAVNTAIAKMAGSPEEKAAIAVKANRAALKGASADNVGAMLAEVFATATPEALSVINENFAKDLVNRTANKNMSPAQYLDIATNLMGRVIARNATVDDAGVRSTFAILMLQRGSEGAPEGLSDTLAAMLDEKTRALATKTWIPAALGIGQEQTYAPMLGYADAGYAPDTRVVVDLLGSTESDLLLNALAMGLNSVSFMPGFGDVAQPHSVFADEKMYVIPRTTDPTKAWYSDNDRGQAPSEEAPYVPPDEPRPYDWQRY